MATIEVIDLLDSSDDNPSAKRPNLDQDDEYSSDLEIFEPAPKRRAPTGEDVVVILDSNSESSPPPQHVSKPEESEDPAARTITLHYKSLVPGSTGSGSFQLKMDDTLQEFAEKFSSDKDDIEIRAADIQTSWYGTPEILFLDDPLANSVNVVVVSKSAGSDDEADDNYSEDDKILVRVNTPNGRLEIRVLKEHTIARLVDWVAQTQGVDASNIKVEFDSDPVDRTDSIGDLEIENEDLLDMIW